MTPVKKRVSSFLTLTTLMLVSAGILFAFYYFHVLENKDYQDRLHFRELNRVSNSITNTYEQITALYNNPIQNTSSSDKVNSIEQSTICAGFLERATQTERFSRLTLSDRPLSQVNKKAVKEGRKPDLNFKFYGNGFAQFNYPECLNRLQFPTVDALPKNLKLFPLIFFTKKGGTILARQHYNNSDVDLTDVSVRSLDILLCKAKLAHRFEPSDDEIAECQQAETKGPGISTMLTTDIRGNKFQAYIQPMKILLGDESEGKYVIGLVPAVEANMDRLAVSPSSIRVLVILFIILIALLPLLKIRFVSSRYGFRTRDVSQAGFGLLIAVGMTTVGVYDQLFYSYFLQDKSEQARAIYNEISQDFNNEVTQLLTTAQRFQHAINNYPKNSMELESLIRCREDNYTNRNESEEKENVPFKSLLEAAKQKSGEKAAEYLIPCLINSDNVFSEKDTESPALINSISVLNKNGLFSLEYPLLFLSEREINNERFDLSHRDYFKAAKACQVWQMKKGICSSGFYIQSIRNVEDGVKSSQFSLPLFANKNDSPQLIESSSDRDRNILIFNTLMTSLTYQALPRNFGFAVINRSGDVLYHSDPHKSLAENFFIETDGVEEILLQAEFADLNRNPVKIRSKYEGSKYTMQVGPIGGEVYQDVPWNLVVFYNEHEADINNMLLIFVASIIFIVFMVPLYLFARYVVKQRFWAEILYYNEQRKQLYPILATLMLLTCLLFLCSINFLEYLLFRFAFWLAIIAFLCWLLQRCFAVDLSMHSRFKSPIYACITASTLSLIAAVLIRDTFLSPFYLNYFTFIVSLLVFFVVAIITLRKAQNAPLNMQSKTVDCDSKRYPYSYILYCFGTVCVVGIGLAAFVTNSANSYLLQRQAELESYAWYETTQEIALQHNAYLHNLGQFNDDKNQRFTAGGNLNQLFPSVDLKEKSTQCLSSIPNFLVASRVEEVSQIGGATAFTDEVIDQIFKTLRLNEPFSARLGFLARMELNDEEPERKPVDAENTTHDTIYDFHYRPDKFLFSAIFIFFWELVVVIALLVAIFLYIFERIIIQRLMAEHLVDQFMSSKLGKKPSLGDILATENAAPCRRKLLMNFSEDEIKQYIAEGGHWFANRIIHIKECIDQHNDKFVLPMSLLGEKSSAVNSVVIEGFEDIAVNKEERIKALNAMREICSFNWLSVFILSDTAPVYRLIKMNEYALSPHEQVNTDEQVAWAKLFAKFDKVYGWSAIKKQAVTDTRNIFDVVDFEGEGWRELAKVKEQFYHFNDIDPVASSGKMGLVNEWEPEQVIEFFLAQAGAFYRKQWELCTLGEKLALYQLAGGAKINPERSDLIEHLQRRGYIYRDKGWHIINDSFKKFILQAESESVFSEWTNQVESSVWQYLRIPLFTALILVGGIVIYSSGQAVDSIIAILTATLSLIPLLLKNIHLIKTGYSGSTG